ncbi:TPM domain-containing protein [Streptomyces sp. JB150]|uniref:TPM domain-containing protein n=1 Tax=Streptomyces sp. JB150 TaxID=2714844 RepID=UPI00140D4B6B|nr:TPM domain-containing protein [Streptomyces sp. JB150]QIJ64565.1 TPM domain-containing protein [Streptomyces sp. JB150]
MHTNTGLHTFVRILVAVLLTAGGLTLATANGAVADAPVDLSRQGQITDRVGALADREPEVAQALTRLADEHGLQLFVVYVDDFSGRSPQQWANATAVRNGLGADDALLAVATSDRQYSYYVEAGSPLTRRDLVEVDATAVAPALRQNDWAGAAIGAARGYDAVLSGQPVPAVDVTPSEAEPGPGEQVGVGTGSWLFLLLVLLPVVLVASALIRRRSRRAAGSRGGEKTWGGPSPDSLADLDAQARQALVRTDDAVRTSQEELGFAAAQFGGEATQPFTEAVEAAKRELTAAFRLRQQLDDAYPEDESTHLQMVQEILTRCAEANRLLDEKAEDFDQLRGFERNAPRALAAAQAAFDTASGRLVSAKATLAAMRERYASSATEPVVTDVEQADSRLQFAQSSLRQARQAVEGNDNGAAAIQVRAAEAAVAQANRLTDAVDRRARELADAAGALPGALTETNADLAEARGLLQGAKELPTAALQGRIARAETVAAEVRRAMERGQYDPIDALRRVEEADAGLDEALMGAQESEQGTRRARALLERTLLSAQSSVGEALDYIITHRGAVGSEARTRLAEAQRRLERAEAFSGRGAGADAHSALAEAQQADALAQDALLLAQEDVEGFGVAVEPGVYAVGSAGSGLAGAMLGGILLGGFGGGYSAGPVVSFGGGGTRARMGGGRF